MHVVETETSKQRRKRLDEKDTKKKFEHGIELKITRRDFPDKIVMSQR